MQVSAKMSPNKPNAATWAAASFQGHSEKHRIADAPHSGMTESANSDRRAAVR
jgi:hypothetical protein